MIIDGHAHAAGVFFSAETLVSALDERGVDKAVLCQNVRFDPEGRCFTRFALPKEEMAFIVKKNKLYTLISENEEGIPPVKRYAMEWK
jgi:hypothetical protein